MVGISDVVLKELKQLLISQLLETLIPGIVRRNQNNLILFSRSKRIMKMFLYYAVRVYRGWNTKRGRYRKCSISNIH